MRQEQQLGAGLGFAHLEMVSVSKDSLSAEGQRAAGFPEEELGQAFLKYKLF